MPALSALTRPDPVTYTAAMGAESVTVTFDAAKMTGRWEQNLAAARNADDRERVTELTLSVFIAWDVVDDAGVPVPISQDILLDLPQKALVNLIEGMTTAAFPSSEEGNGSGDTSSTAGMDSTVLPVSPPNGLPISPSQPLSTSPSPT